MNTFGHILKLTTFGESHGVAIGGVLDGFPAGIKVDLSFIQQELNRRKPGQNKLTTSRKEDDEVNILSGVYDGYTTGCPIGFMVKNKEHHSSDYNNLEEVYRPSHADFAYDVKYGIRDHRGGGRSSARETISRVVGGAFAKMALSQLNIVVQAYTSQVGPIRIDKSYSELDLSCIDANAVRCPDEYISQEMIKLIEEVKLKGDTIGGVITGVLKNVPVGLGEPVFNKLHVDLGAAMLSINAVKGFEYGDGFSIVEKRGSQVNDIFYTLDDGTVATHSNHSGGIQGGISNGQDIVFRVAFKPVATVLFEQETIDKNGHFKKLKVRGRHDPCVVTRAVPIVEAMAAMIVLDHVLLQKTNHL